MSQEVIEYLHRNKNRLLEQLKQFLAIPSISTETKYEQHVREAADFVEQYLRQIGFDDVKLVETKGHPIVYGMYDGAGPDAETVLLYGHYDVQPVDPLNEWETEPFEPTIKNGRIYARGASDDKGQIFMHLAVFEAFMKTKGQFPLNVKVCIEGEEEIGSKHLYERLEKEPQEFAADFAVISDSGMIASGQPTILYGLKGFTGLEFTVHGPSHDLHSGMYGGAVKNPLIALANIITSMKNEDEIVTIDGFYDQVEPLTEHERKLMSQIEGEDYVQTTGAPEVVSEKGYTATEHTMARPTLDVNGMYGGYQGEGSKTIIPASATAKITCRLVPGQDPDRIQQLLIEHIEKVTPRGVTVDIQKEPLHAKAYKVDPTHPYIQKAAESYTRAFQKETVFVRMGGSIPVVEWLDSFLEIPVVLLGFGTPEDRIHAPNESFPIENFEKGMETLVYYWNEWEK